MTTLGGNRPVSLAYKGVQHIVAPPGRPLGSVTLQVAGTLVLIASTVACGTSGADRHIPGPASTRSSATSKSDTDEGTSRATTGNAISGGKGIGVSNYPAPIGRDTSLGGDPLPPPSASSAPTAVSSPVPVPQPFPSFISPTPSPSSAAPTPSSSSSPSNSPLSLSS